MPTEGERIVKDVLLDLDMGMEVGSDYLYEYGDEPETLKVTKYNEDGTLGDVVGILRYEEKL